MEGKSNSLFLSCHFFDLFYRLPPFFKRDAPREPFENQPKGAGSLIFGNFSPDGRFLKFHTFVNKKYTDRVQVNIDFLRILRYSMYV